MTTTDRAPRPPSILLVEDNEDDAFFTRRALERDGGVNVVVARDGPEALDILLPRRGRAERAPDELPDLVLLDINLPRLSGIGVLRRLREEERTRLLPVVMLTSSRDERDVVASYTGGANSYLQKPVGTTAFNEMVGRVKSYWLGLNLPPDADPDP